MKQDNASTTVKRVITGKQYVFPCILIASIAAGCITGLLWPEAGMLKPLGTVFINLMFCIVVPLVFSSIAGAIANVKNRSQAGKVLGTSIAVFVITGLIAAMLMVVVVIIFPPVLTPWPVTDAAEETQALSISDTIVRLLTADDFVNLLSRNALLPLIIFAILFGFGVNLNGGAGTPVAVFLDDMNKVILKVVKIITYYAPVAFFAIFADLASTFGRDIAVSYGRALLIYVPVSLAYALIFFPLYTRIGGGPGSIRIMLKHIFKPMIVSFGTCSSSATIPTNLAQTNDTGIPEDVSGIVIPLGATMHMDGSCMSCILKIAFACGVLGIPLEWSNLPLILAISIISSVGFSGVPGGGFIGEYLIAGLMFPEHTAFVFPILASIGSLIDPLSTMINTSGDYIACFLVSRYCYGRDWLSRKLHSQKEP